MFCRQVEDLKTIVHELHRKDQKRSELDSRMEHAFEENPKIFAVIHEELHALHNNCAIIRKDTMALKEDVSMLWALCGVEEGEE
jgi:hypothetical protein